MSFESKLPIIIPSFMLIVGLSIVSQIMTKYIIGAFNCKPIISKVKIFTYSDGYRTALQSLQHTVS